MSDLRIVVDGQPVPTLLQLQATQLDAANAKLAQIAEFVADVEDECLACPKAVCLHCETRGLDAAKLRLIVGRP